MKLAIPRERLRGETRVAGSPDSVRKLCALGVEVWVEAGAGNRAFFDDEQFRQAGARIGPSEREVIVGAAVVCKVRAPTTKEIRLFTPGTILVGMLEPYHSPDALASYAQAGVVAFSLELLPRITRAQSMDVLSSQSNLAGYKAMIDAAATLHRAMPMMMTAAGTVAPARVLVMGAGVAGLQAIATARRLGAIVSAADVRPAAKEQVESLGASFLSVDSAEGASAETAGGYAREMSQDYQRRQAQLVQETLRRQDIVICTALVPGKPAPILITEEMVRSMKPGSVIVDLAADHGGNCALTRIGARHTAHQVRILGYRNVPARLPADASTLYAKNVLNFVAPMIGGAEGGPRIDWDDEIIRCTALTRDGEVIHPAFAATMEATEHG